MTPVDPYDLRRFIDAQQTIYSRARSELVEGHKRSHWMWFIFPQISGLGLSEMARRFAISTRAEAKAYLAHPILGPRLKDCTRLVTRIEGQTAGDIFGRPDDMKFRSSMTLFAAASDSGIFDEALRKYFNGVPDPLTLKRLNC